MEKACWFGLKRNIHGRPGKSRRKAEIEPARGCSLPCAGWRLWAWSWLVSGNQGKRGRQGCFASLRWSGRRSGRDGSSARTGSTLPPAHGFSTLSLALQPIRDEPSESFAARCRAAPGAPVPARLGRPATKHCPNSSLVPHPPLRAPACRTSVMSRSGQNRIRSPQPTPRARPS